MNHLKLQINFSWKGQDRKRTAEADSADETAEADAGEECELSDPYDWPELWVGGQQSQQRKEFAFFLDEGLRFLNY